KEIDLFKKWIAGGLLETSGSKALAAAKPKVDLSIANVSVGKPDGPPPMPKDLLMEPFVRTERTSVSTGLASSPCAVNRAGRSETNSPLPQRHTRFARGAALQRRLPLRHQV